MAEIASAYVSLIPSARGFGRATSAQINPQMRTTGATAGAALGKSMLKAFIAIGVATKVASFLGDSVAEAREAQKVGALTANVIKSTGGAAKVAQVQVERLSNALSKKVGIDDEEIQSGSNLILTFKNIKREGTGLNNIFARATRAGVDLAASGFGSIESASKQIGKALNDPIKGLTQLTRVGVTFTAQQTKMIKNAVLHNNVLRAQRIILREVESQVGGAAEAQATNADKARVALQNLKEQIGTALLPALDAMSGAFATKIAPAISSFITDLQSGSGSAGSFAATVRNSLPPILNGLKSAFKAVSNAVRDNRPQLEQLGRAILKLGPIAAKFSGQQLKTLGQSIRVVITILAAGVNAFNAVSHTISTTAAAVKKGGTAFSQLAVTVRQKISNVVSTVKGIPGKVQAVFAGAITFLLGAGRALIQGLINGIAEKIGEAIQKVKDGLTKIRNLLPGSPIKDGPLKPWNGGRPGRLLMEMLAKGIAEGAKTAADAAGDAATNVGKKLKEKLSKVRDTLSSVRSDFASLVEPIASNFTQGLFDFDTASAFTANLTTVKGTLTTLLGNFKTLIAEGLSPGFLYQLFQSGGPGLINSLAGLDKAGAQNAASLFGQVTDLSNQLGTQVAGATDKGAALENQTARLERKLDHLIAATKKVGADVGDRVNGAAANGHRRAA